MYAGIGHANTHLEWNIKNEWTIENAHAEDENLKKYVAKKWFAVDFDCA